MHNKCNSHNAAYIDVIEKDNRRLLTSLPNLKYNVDTVNKVNFYTFVQNALLINKFVDIRDSLHI